MPSRKAPATPASPSAGAAKANKSSSVVPPETFAYQVTKATLDPGYRQVATLLDEWDASCDCEGGTIPTPAVDEYTQALLRLSLDPALKILALALGALMGNCCAAVAVPILGPVTDAIKRLSLDPGASRLGSARASMRCTRSAAPFDLARIALVVSGMHPSLLAALVILAACTIPDPDTVPLRCDSSNPCPSGRVCLETGECTDPVDMSIATLPDSAPPDDLTTADMTEPSGCKGSGARLAQGQWRCLGAFGGMNPKASELCATGFALCAKLDPAALQICNTAAGFFASPIIGSRRDFAPIGTGQCDQRELYAVVYGCGSNGLAASLACSGFDRLIDCNQQGVTWTCNTTLDATTQKNALNGVLCCKT